MESHVKHSTLSDKQFNLHLLDDPYFNIREAAEL